MKKALAIALVACALVGTASVTNAATITVNSTGQAGWYYYPYSWGAWTNGANDLANNDYEFVKFQNIDFSSLGTINSAVFNIAPNNDDTYASNSTLNVYSVVGSWELDGNPRPTSVGSLATTVTYAGQNVVVSGDITSVVSNWNSSGIQNGVALKLGSPGDWTNSFRGVSNMSVTIDYTAVPEPAMAGLLVLGMAGTMLRRRSRKA